jgi:hypothetical protein
MFKVIIDFKEFHMLGINSDDPESTAQKIKKLYEVGKIKPEINEIAVFDPEDESGFDPPLFVLKDQKF